MQRYSICVLQPPGYVHVRAFDEVVQALAFSLGELGHSVTVQTNCLDAGARNVLLGAHLAPPDAVQDLPSDSVILNTEQLAGADGSWTRSVVDWGRRYTVWDYSERNIAFLRNLGVGRVARLRLGFQHQLARIRRAQTQDIDVLFYGSIGPRRAHVLEALKARGLRVGAVFGVYGEERDALISRSRLVLNLHHYDTKILEVVRLFYLMSNAKAVVCELGPDTAADLSYLDGLCTAPYEGLVDACVQLVGNDIERRTLEARAIACIKRHPQTGYTRELLQEDARVNAGRAT